MSEIIEDGAEPQAEKSKRQRRPWSPPRLILSDLTITAITVKTTSSHPESHQGASTLSVHC